MPASSPTSSRPREPCATSSGRAAPRPSGRPRGRRSAHASSSPTAGAHVTPARELRSTRRPAPARGASHARRRLSSDRHLDPLGLEPDRDVSRGQRARAARPAPALREIDLVRRQLDRRGSGAVCVALEHDARAGRAAAFDRVDEAAPGRASSMMGSRFMPQVPPSTSSTSAGELPLARAAARAARARGHRRP